MAQEPAPALPLTTTSSDALDTVAQPGQPRAPGSGGDSSPGYDGGRPQSWIRAHRDALAQVIAVIVFLGAWQGTGAFLPPLFVSTPSRVVSALISLIGDGKLPSAFGTSLFEMVAGMVVAAIVGIGVGLAMGRVRVLERALEPIVAFGNATPSIALLPVMEVWFGINSLARIAFITVLCTWPLIVNTYAGVKAVRGRYTDVGVSFGLGGWMQTWKIALPGTMPFIFVGLRISLAVGAVGMILGGQEIGQSGLGGLTAVFGSYSETSDLVAAIVTTTALALLLFAVFRQIQARRFPWIAATSAGRRESK